MAMFGPDVERTARLMNRARKVLAYGGLDGIVHRPLMHERGTFPQFVEAAEGCRMVDSTGQAYIDWVNGWGPTILGYRHPEVEAAIVEALRAGPSVSLMHPVEVEVAELLSEMIPNAEMVAFGKNGSDSLTAAARVARAVTGRELILQYGMHGFHDWFVSRLAHVRGVPGCLHGLVKSFPFNDLAALEALFEAHPGQVAAVMMEPSREQEPAPGYLQGIKDLCRKHGALWIWDEVITALRFGVGGAQTAYGISPDLSCLGKSLANGMPLSALVGRREYMQYTPSVGFGMTFRGETLSLSAARATLQVCRREPVAERLAEAGTRLRRRFEADCADLGLDWAMVGHPARISVRFGGGNGWNAESLRDLFLQECLKNGVFTNGNFLASMAHDEAAVDCTAGGVRRALETVAQAFRLGPQRLAEPVGGFPHGPKIHSARGSADRLWTEGHVLHMSGWLLLHDGPADEVHVRRPDGQLVPAAKVARPDIAGAFPHTSGAEGAGFGVSVPEALVADGTRHEVDLLVSKAGREVFSCRIVKYAVADAQVGGPFWLGDGVLYI